MFWKRDKPAADEAKEEEAALPSSSEDAESAPAPSQTDTPSETKEAGPSVFEFGGLASGESMTGFCTIDTKDRLQPCAWRLDSTPTPDIKREKYQIRF